MDSIESEFIEREFGRKKYRISTPSAVVTDSETDFVVAYNPDTKVTNVHVFDGAVDVDNLKGKIIQLHAGEAVAVGANGEMTVMKFSEEEAEKLKNEVSPFDSVGELASDPNLETEPTTYALVRTLILTGLLVCAVAVLFLYRKFRTGS